MMRPSTETEQMESTILLKVESFRHNHQANIHTKLRSSQMTSRQLNKTEPKLVLISASHFFFELGESLNLSPMPGPMADAYAMQYSDFESPINQPIKQTMTMSIMPWIFQVTMKATAAGNPWLPK